MGSLLFGELVDQLSLYRLPQIFRSPDIGRVVSTHIVQKVLDAFQRYVGYEHICYRRDHSRGKEQQRTLDNLGDRVECGLEVQSQHVEYCILDGIH